MSSNVQENKLADGGVEVKFQTFADVKSVEVIFIFLGGAILGTYISINIPGNFLFNILIAGLLLVVFYFSYFFAFKARKETISIFPNKKIVCSVGSFKETLQNLFTGTGSAVLKP